MYRLAGGLLGLAGVVVMAYFNFFAATPNSRLSWLGAALFIAGLAALLVSRSRSQATRTGHGKSSPEA